MSLFRKESVDYKRQKLHGEVILVQPVRFFVITAVFFVLTLTLLAFLSRGEFHRKENVFGYINPSKGMSVIRAEQGGRLTQMYVNEGDIVEVGQILFESQIDISTENGFIAERRLENTDVRLLELKDQKSAIKQRYSLDRDRLSTQISILERELQTLRNRENLQYRSTQISRSRLEKFERLRRDETVSALEFENVRGKISMRNSALKPLNNKSLASSGI